VKDHGPDAAELAARFSTATPTPARERSRLAATRSHPHAEMRALHARIFMRCLVCRYPNRAIVKSSLSIMSEAHLPAEYVWLSVPWG